MTSSATKDEPLRLPKAQKLSELSDSQLSTFFKDINVVMFDCDVLWHVDGRRTLQPLKNAIELVAKLRKIGKKVFFVTNNGCKTRETFLERFTKLGFTVTKEEIISSAYLTALYLKQINFQKKIYVVGTKGLVEELSNFGFSCLPLDPDLQELQQQMDKPDFEIDPEVGAVVVGYDAFFNYDKLLKAGTYLSKRDEVLFIATNPDEWFPGNGINKGLVFPDTGTLVKAVQTCAGGREPIFMGKPSPFGFKLIQKQFDLGPPEQILMIGDRGNTDILFGRKTGMTTLLVLSGVSSLEEMHQWEESKDPEVYQCTPHYYSKDVDEIYNLFCKFAMQAII